MKAKKSKTKKKAKAKKKAAPKQSKYIRTVFGRLRVQAGSREHVFELTKEGLKVRPRGTPRSKARLYSFDQLLAIHVKKYVALGRVYTVCLTDRGAEVFNGTGKVPDRVINPELLVEGHWLQQQELI